MRCFCSCTQARNCKWLQCAAGSGKLLMQEAAPVPMRSACILSPQPNCKSDSSTLASQCSNYCRIMNLLALTKPRCILFSYRLYTGFILNDKTVFLSLFRCQHTLYVKTRAQCYRTRCRYQSGSSCASSVCRCPCWRSCTSCTGTGARRCGSECGVSIC